MSVELLLVVAAITYGSRMLGIVVLPVMSPRIAAVLDRMPPALFAALAMQALVAPGPSPAEPAVVAAAAGALLVAPLRSLPVCLAAGIAAYTLMSAVT